MKRKKSDYSAKLLDPRWQKKRLKVLERDEFTCQICGATDKTLHVHHSHYRTDADGPWDYADASLVTVCNDCHEGEHENFSDIQKSLFEVVCNAGFSTAERQLFLVGSLNLLSGMSRDDMDSFKDIVSEFIALRAIKNGSEWGHGLLQSVSKRRIDGAGHGKD